MKLTLVATCMFGLEKLLGEEIDALGLTRLSTMDGRVTFEGTPADIPRANIALRCAERIFVCLGTFPARSFAELFDGTRALPWEDWIGRTDAFPVKGHAIKSTLTSVPDCQSIVKKAVVERLHAAYGISWFEESGAKYQIEFFLFKDVAALMLDTSGVALHKRGYRPEAGAAPLRETLAAALALTARPREDILFWDPFCGSGTIAIEAAMIVTGRSPGLGRGFAGEAKADLRAAGKLADKAGVVAADLAQDIFAKAEDHAAQTLFVQKRAAVMLGKAEMRTLVLCDDARADLRAQFTGQGSVFFKAFAVHIDFPADAAAVAAVVGDAAKVWIIIWCDQFHGHSTISPGRTGAFSAEISR